VIIVSFSHSKLTGVLLITGGARRTRTKGDTCKYCWQEEMSTTERCWLLTTGHQKEKKKNPTSPVSRAQWKILYMHSYWKESNYLFSSKCFCLLPCWVWHWRQ